MNISASASGKLVTERSRSFRYLMFGMLYFVQGIIVAFTGNFAKPYLNSFNIDADLIGLLFTLLLVPFIFKIFYGMLSDRVNLFGRGHRLPYIVVALIISIIMMIIIITIIIIIISISIIVIIIVIIISISIIII